MSIIKLEMYLGNITGICNTPIILRSVSTNRTIGSLKSEFHEKYPVAGVNDQIWIIRNLISFNDETLNDLNIHESTFGVIYIRGRDDSTVLNDKTQPDDFSKAFREALSDKYNGAILYPRRVTPVIPSIQAVDITSWRCVGCTLINDVSNIRCEVCDTPRCGTGPIRPSSPVGRVNIPKAPNRPLPPPPPPGMTRDEILIQIYGWECPTCTLMNEATRPGCAECYQDRPVHYQLPPPEHLTEKDVLRLQRLNVEETRMRQFLAEERRHQVVEAEANSHVHVHSEMNHQYYPNTEAFDCVICMEHIAIGEGVILRNCAHMFCRQCVVDSIKASHAITITCPADVEGDGGRVPCAKPLQDREIAGILDNEEDLRERFRRATVATAEHLGALADNPNANDGRIDKVFRCLTPDCEYFLLYVHDDVGQFTCPKCKIQNCISCKARHAPITCKEYQDEQRRLRLRGEYENRDLQMEEELLRQHQAMRCPGCQRVTVKNGGCPNMHCVRCNANFVWNP